jgi:IS30 family transposase
MTVMKTGQNLKEIAEVIEVHKSTIIRERQRNRYQLDCQPKQAHRIAMERCIRFRKIIDAVTSFLVEKLIRDDWSPARSSNRLRGDHYISIIHEWIYQHILVDKRAGGDMHLYRCIGSPAECATSAPNGVSIFLGSRASKKDGIVDKRGRLGDWKVDTALGKGRRDLLVA